jgi:predicted TIM-barrel enzyme
MYAIIVVSPTLSFSRGEERGKDVVESATRITLHVVRGVNIPIVLRNWFLDFLNTGLRAEGKFVNVLIFTITKLSSL